MKILFDTNVLVSAFVAHGYSAEVLQDAMYSHEVYYSAYIYSECEDVLRKKFHLSENVIEDLLAVLKNHLIEGTHAQDVENVCRDATDDPILADAVANKVDIIITGDKDLLVVAKYRGIRIISPKEYWAL